MCLRSYLTFKVKPVQHKIIVTPQIEEPMMFDSVVFKCKKNSPGILNR